MQIRGAHIDESCHTNDLSDKSYLYEVYLCRLLGKLGQETEKTWSAAGRRNVTDALAAAPLCRLVVLGEPGGRKMAPRRCVRASPNSAGSP